MDRLCINENLWTLDKATASSSICQLGFRFGWQSCSILSKIKYGYTSVHVDQHVNPVTFSTDCQYSVRVSRRLDTASINTIRCIGYKIHIGASGPYINHRPRR